MQQIKLDVADESYKTLVDTAKEESVSLGEIVRRALSLYINVRKALVDKDQITITHRNMRQI